jgi:beta-glucosidase
MEIAIPTEEKTSKRAIGTWDDAYTKATAALAKLSASDKIGIVTGTGWQGGNCVGNTKAASSIGYPSLCLQGKLYENFGCDSRASIIWLDF